MGGGEISTFTHHGLSRFQHQTQELKLQLFGWFFFFWFFFNLAIIHTIINGFYYHLVIVNYPFDKETRQIMNKYLQGKKFHVIMFGRPPPFDEEPPQTMCYNVTLETVILRQTII